MWSTRMIILVISLFIMVKMSISQKLDAFEDKAKGKSESNINSHAENSDQVDMDIRLLDDVDADDVETTLNLFAIFIDATGSLLFHMPEVEGDINFMKYSRYPYSDGYSGVYCIGGAKSVSIKADVNYFQLNRNLTGIGLKTRLSPHPFLDFQLDFLRLSENTDYGNDHLDFFNAFLNFNRIRSEFFTLSWGLGLKAISGESSQSAFGLNFISEIFPVRPISVGINYNVGFFKGASVDEMQLILNLHIQRFKISIGYQKYRAGDIDFPGLTAGLGIYL